MDSVKQLPRQIKSASNTPVVLSLSPELVNDARTIVSICRRIDWGKVTQTQCDTIEIHFQAATDVQTGYRLMMEMAADAPEIRNDIIKKIEEAFHWSGFTPY